VPHPVGKKLIHFLITFNQSDWTYVVTAGLGFEPCAVFIVSAYEYIAITNLPITAVFVEYLRQFLIDLNQIYSHSSVPKTRLVHFLSFLAQSVSEHGAAATFFQYVCVTV